MLNLIWPLKATKPSQATLYFPGEVVKNNPRMLTKGQAAVVELRPKRPMCVETYEDYRALGRIAVRSSGETVAIGVVLSL